ncbi:MAG TPA: peptidoglycan-associated lipoprotein Pal [Burkholderiales bacterium]|nr:peptidoglycan-associated lipoprotein Pal [Burkholderiales bacterium]
MRAILVATLCSAALLLGAACSTTPEDQAAAGVEDRTGKGGKPGADTRAVQPPKVAAVDLSKPPAPGSPSALAALKDPNNVLSKRSIYYELDKFDVKDEYRSLVEAHAKYLRENPSARMMIQGNTDERGSREYNVGLGQRRSDGVKRMMILLGARENQIESVSLGEEKPQSDGHDEGAWSKNRRSDILYGGEY